MSKIFVDTNVLVYAHDRSQPGKWARARELVKQFETLEPTAVVSTQVLQEYYQTLTRKLLLSKADAKAELERLTYTTVVVMTPQLILAAADIHASASISFWDALIVAAAQSADCQELWSEDLQDGQRFAKLKVVNPFAGIAGT